MSGLLIIFFIALILSGIVNWILIRFSINLGVRNISKEDEIRWQVKKPSIGGLSFYIVFLILYSVLSNICSMGILQNIHFISKNDVSLIIASSVGFLIGLIDDARNTNPLLKMFGQIMSGVILVYFGVIIELSPNHFWNCLLTVLWTIFLMNSINMLDNMDGLTSSICFYILVGTLTFTGLHHFNFSGLMMIVCAGAILGFLYYNWNPSRIYMGDSGSQFLGIILAHFSILFLWNERSAEGGYFQLKQFILPLLIFTIPIFDTATVSIHRLLRKQSPFVGGRDHLSHHLVYLGLKDYQAVYLLGFINFIFIFLVIYHYKYQISIYPLFIFWLISFIIFQYFYVAAKKFKPLET